MLFRRPKRLLVGVLGAYLLGSLAAAVLLAEAAAHPPRLPVYETTRAQTIARRFGATVEDAQITADDGVVLRAWHVSPLTPNGRTVILLHGVGDTRMGMAGYARLFVSHGYSVLLADSRAHGESGGRMATYGVLEADDVHRWADWVETRDQPACLYGMGESMGAAIVLESLRTEPRFCAVIAESPFATFREVAYDRVGQKFHTGPWLGRTVLRPAIEGALLYYRLKYGVDLTEASPEAAVAHTSIPVLLIHGLADRNIRPRHSEELRDSNPSEVSLWEVRGAVHCGAVTVAPEEFTRRVLGWFDVHGAV